MLTPYLLSLGRLYLSKCSNVSCRVEPQNSVGECTRLTTGKEVTYLER